MSGHTSKSTRAMTVIRKGLPKRRRAQREAASEDASRWSGAFGSWVCHGLPGSASVWNRPEKTWGYVADHIRLADPLYGRPPMGAGGNALVLLVWLPPVMQEIFASYAHVIECGLVLRPDVRTGFPNPDLFDHFAHSGHRLFTPSSPTSGGSPRHEFHAAITCARSR